MSVLEDGSGKELLRYVNVLAQAGGANLGDPSRNLLLSLNSMTYDDVNNAGVVDNVHVGWEIMQSAADTGAVSDTVIMLGNCMFPEGVGARFIGIGVNMGYDDATSNSIDQPVDSIFIGHEILNEVLNPTANYDESVLIGNNIQNDGVFNDNCFHNVFVGYGAGGSTAMAGSFDSNVGIGHTAFEDAVLIQECVAVGILAGALSNGPDNTFVGASAGLSTAGANNTAIGAFAMSQTSGANNSVLGENAATNIGTVNRISVMGHLAATSVTNPLGLADFISIGYQSLNGFTTTAATDLEHTIAIGNDCAAGASGDFQDTIVIGADALPGASDCSNDVCIGTRVGHNNGAAGALTSVDKTVMLGKRVLADVGSTGFTSVTNSILIGHECFDTVIATGAPVISDITAIGFEIFKGAAMNGANTFHSLVAIGDKIGAGMASKNIRESILIGDNVLNGNLATGTHDASVYIGNNAMLGGTGADDKSGSVAIGSAAGRTATGKFEHSVAVGAFSGQLTAKCEFSNTVGYNSMTNGSFSQCNVLGRRGMLSNTGTYNGCIAIGNTIL